MSTKGPTGPQHCISGVYNVTPITLGDGQQAPIQLAANGAVLISGSITASNPSVAATGTADPGFATEIGILVGGNLVGVSASNPLPISGTISAASSLNATATLPTLAPGSQSPQGSLAGAGYAQLVFGSASGGGTQVDGTHGLPVQLLAGTAIAGKVGIDQTTPGTTNLVDASNFPVTVDTNAGAAGASTLRAVIATGGATVPISALSIGATASGVPADAEYVGLIAKTANPTAASDGNLVGAMADKLGRQVTVIGNVRDNKASNTITLSSTASATLVSGIASVFNDIYGLILANQSATGVTITLLSSSGATGIPFYIPPTDTRGFMLPSSDGLKQNTTGTNWTAALSAGSITVKATALYVKNI